jgi:hypothetical protein
VPLRDTEIDLDFRGDTLAELEGEALVPEGRYHIVLTSVKREEGGGGSPCFRARYRVLAGTNPAAKGMAASERFHLSEDAKKRLKILAKRLGLVGDADIGVKTGTFDFQAAVGRELVVEVKHEHFTTKKGEPATASKWTFAGFFVPEDPRAAGCPLDPEAAAQVRREIGLGSPARPRQTTMPGTPTPNAYDDI